MKDYEKPWMEIVCINSDVITASCMDDYECDTEGPSVPVCVSGLPE